MLPLYGASLGVSTAQIGLVISAFGLARLLTNLPAALLSDRFGRRMLLVGGPLISTIGNILCGFASSLEPLLIFRFIAGIGSAMFITGAVIYISDTSRPGNRGTLMSYYQGAFSVGLSLGPVVGGFVAEIFGLHAPFFAIGLFSLASGIWAFLNIPETRQRSNLQEKELEISNPKEPPNKEKDVKFRDFALSANFLLIALVFAVQFFTRGGSQFTLLPLKASRDLNLSAGTIGLLFALPAIVNIIVLIPAGSLSDRSGRKMSIVPGLLFFAVSLVVAGATHYVWMFAVGMIMFGAAQGVAASAPSAYVADIAPDKLVAFSQGMSRTVGDFALVVGPPIMGLAADHLGNTTTLMANAVLLTLAAFIFMAFAKEIHVRKPATASVAIKTLIDE